MDLLESPVAKHESLSPVRLDRAEATSMDDLFGPPSDTEMQDAVVIEREEHEIDELESPVPATLWPASPNKKGKSPVNPLEMIDEDIEGLMAESMRTILKPQSVLPSLESSVKINKNRPVIASPAKKGENVEWRQWRHVLQDRFPELDLNSLGKQHTLFTIGFLNRNKIDQRRIMSGKQSAPGIPSDFWDTFTAEFQTKFPPKALTDLNQGDIEEILEEGTSLNPVQSPELQAAVSMPASSKAAPNAVTLPEFTTVSNTSPLTGFLALESRAISPKKTVTSQVPSFEVVARQTPILIDDESDKDWTLIRYNMYVYFLAYEDVRRVLG